MGADLEGILMRLDFCEGFLKFYTFVNSSTLISYGGDSES